jgi:hypothetical protein
MRTVYVVLHVHVIEDEDEIKLIGVYSSRKQAEAAVERMKQQPGFREEPRGFSIDPYALNQDNWTEGYITVFQSSTAHTE